MKEKCDCCSFGLDPDDIQEEYYYCAICDNEFPINQPERLNPKTYYRNEDGTYPPLEPCIGCDSLNSAHN